MQLKSRAGVVAPGLGAAVCALLGSADRPALAAQVDASTLVYSESNRVTAVETVVEGTRESDDGRSLGVKLTLDSLTGASANGATPANRVQTFTRPSGQASYTARAGETPLDPTFQDFRLAGAVNAARPFGRANMATYGANLSVEQDYLSIGLSGGLSRDFALKNTTLGFGASVSRDSVRPRSGAPTPFTSLGASTGGNGDDHDRATEDGEGGEGGDVPGKSKTTGDAMLSLTQVLSRSTLARLNYSIGWNSGYLTDPYKILSLVQSPQGTSPGDPVDYLFERRPNHRMRQSGYAELRQRVGRDVAQASYRYYSDDWSVESATVDAHLTHRLGARTSITPHYRWYEQTAANFYRRYLVQGEALPAYASADYRLGSFKATTVGLEAAHTLESNLTLRGAVEKYVQTGDDHPPRAFGALVGNDLFPSVSAWMVRAGVSFPIDW